MGFDQRNVAQHGAAKQEPALFPPADSYQATDDDLPAALLSSSRSDQAKARILKTAEQMFDAVTVESVRLLLIALQSEVKP